ncbi:lipopolysaccharide biosynthesis protein [Aurantivibrio plasticivorans]
MPALFKRFSSFSLRGGVLLIKFILTAALVKLLDPESYGRFILYFGLLQLLSAFAPLDLYSKTARDLLRPGRSQQHAFSRHFSSLFVVLPVFCLFGYTFAVTLFDFFEAWLWLVFFGHVYFESIFTDLCRLAVALRKQMVSIIFQFVYASLWFLTWLIYCLFSGDVSLTSLIICWFGFSVFVTVILFLNLAAVTGFIFEFKAKWFSLACKASGVFLISTIVYRSLITGDRFFVEQYYTLELVGVYGFYTALLVSGITLLQAGVSSWYYPEILSLSSSGDKKGLYKVLRAYLIQNSLSAIVLYAFMCVAVYMACYVYFPQIYSDNYLAFLVLLGGYLSLSISLPFHYVVYSLRRDWLLVFIHFSGLFVYCCFFHFVHLNNSLLISSVLLSSALLVIAVARVVIAYMYLISGAHLNPNKIGCRQ